MEISIKYKKYFIILKYNKNKIQNEYFREQVELKFCYGSY